MIPAVGGQPDFGEAQSSRASLHGVEAAAESERFTRNALADIAVVVVSYHTGPVLQQCLERISKADGICEIIIVDNGNTPEDEFWIDSFAARTSGARVLRGSGNIGFGAACNLGAEQARSPWLLFVNPDLLIDSNAPYLLRSFAAERDGMTLVGGCLVGPDGREQRGCRREEITAWSAFVAGAGLGQFERLWPAFRTPHRECDPTPEAPIEVAAVSGALFLTSKRAFFEVGGFDEAFFLHVEDVDLCARFRASGGSVWFHPEARGLHIGATSSASPTVVAFHKARSFYIYLKKKQPSLVGRFVAFGLSVSFFVVIFWGIQLRAVRRGRWT